MWVYDGETWTEDVGNEHRSPARPEKSPERYSELVPELQVIEIHIPQKTPVPLPLVP
jgi:hypothetical protein